MQEHSLQLKKWLKTLLQNLELNDYFFNQRTEWCFNLVRSILWGGFLIAIMKILLLKAIGRGFLTYSELEEVLLDIECAMNYRPLSYQSEDSGNKVITKNILLRDRPAQLLEDLQKLNEKDNVTKRIMYVKSKKKQEKTG